MKMNKRLEFIEKNTKINNMAAKPKQENKEASKKLPTAQEMKEFAARFTKEEWNKLTKWNDFYKVFDQDLDACRILCEKILAGKWNGSTR